MSTFFIEREINRLMYLVATNPQPYAHDVQRLEELVRLARRRVCEGYVD